MNLPDLLQSLGIPYKQAGEHEHVRGDFVGIDCPWCSPDSGRFRLGISPKGYATCWNCGYVRLGESLVQASNEPWHKIGELLRHLEKPQRPLSPGVSRNKRVITPPGLTPLRNPHRAYLKSRGFDSGRLERLWLLRGCGPVGRLAWRIFIPIQLDGEIVSWTSRSIGQSGHGPKYLSARVDEEAVPLKSLLYGVDYARHTIIVCEGPTDVWKIGPGAVAVFGLQYTRSQVIQIAEYPVRVICFDREREAQKKANILARSLEEWPGRTEVIELETGNDPGSASPDEIREIRTKYFGERALESYEP